MLIWFHNLGVAIQSLQYLLSNIHWQCCGCSSMVKYMPSPLKPWVWFLTPNKPGTEMFLRGKRKWWNFQLELNTSDGRNKHCIKTTISLSLDSLCFSNHRTSGTKSLSSLGIFCQFSAKIFLLTELIFSHHPRQGVHPSPGLAYRVGAFSILTTLPAPKSPKALLYGTCWVCAPQPVQACSELPVLRHWQNFLILIFLKVFLKLFFCHLSEKSIYTVISRSIGNIAYIFL